ncbi:MAG: hypothetical protein ACFFEJ_15510 [Candidatus Thorarchaeota archaeon]
MNISRALQFLDMIQQGYADFGKIKDTKVPEVYSQSGMIAYGSALNVLGKFDPELRRSFSSALSEKLTPEVSTWTRWFISITILGSLIGIVALLALEFLRLFGIIPTEIAFPVMVSGFVIIMVLVLLITIYAFKNEGKDPPQGVLDAIAEPQVRFEAERAFERIIEVFKEESTRPIRVVVIGEYDTLEYTEETFRTSKDLELRVAILNPRASMDW